MAVKLDVWDILDDDDGAVDIEADKETLPVLDADSVGLTDSA